MQIQIRPGRAAPDADGVHPRITQAEQIVEDDRMQRIAQLQQTLRGRVQMAALVRGTDDEHPHVLLAGGIQRRAVVLADEIPVHVHVVEGAAVAAGGDQSVGPWVENPT